MDVHSRFAFRVGGNTPLVAGAGTGNGQDPYGTIVELTGHAALPGDFVRFIDGNAAYLEVAIVQVIDANNFRLAARIPDTPIDLVPAAGDEFYLMRYVTQLTDDSGAQSVVVTPAPISFVRDGVDTEVEISNTVPANSRPLPVQQVGSYINSIRLDYSVTNVTNGAWVQLIASVGAGAIHSVTLFDGGGFAMELGIGAAAAEVRALLIPPGGFNGVIPLQIPAGSRLSIRAVGAALVNEGEIDINLMR